VFLEVRDAAAKILENTTIADIIGGNQSKKGKGRAAPVKKRVSEA